MLILELIFSPLSCYNVSMKKTPKLSIGELTSFYPKVAIIDGEPVPIQSGVPEEYDFILESTEALGESEVWVRETSKGTFYIHIGAIASEPLVLIYFSESTSTGQGYISFDFEQNIDPDVSDFNLITASGSLSGASTNINVEYNPGLANNLNLYLIAPQIQDGDIITVTIPSGAVVGTNGEQITSPIVFTVDVYAGS